jgi:N-acetylmuramoyl-L-alanine amidase
MQRKLFIIYILLMFVLLSGLAAGEESEDTTRPGDTEYSAVNTVKKTDKGTHSRKKARAGASAKKSAKSVKKRAVIYESSELTGVPSQVQEMRYWSNPDYTRIAVTLDREATFEYHQLPPNRENAIPPRLYIDISGARMTPGVKDIPIGDGLLKMARAAQYRQDTVRIVLDLDSIKDYKIFTFSNPFRIIIDVMGERKTEISRAKEPILAPLPDTAAIKPAPAEESAKVVKKPAIGKIRRIVIDAGHGGHDPGALGGGGSREKDIVLQIALKLAHKLREELGLDVVLTRSTDVFIELQERTAIANKVGADLFVSIHANASLNRNASGIETYYLNLAKTEKVAQLAAKENGTSLEKVSILQAVLFDLMANYKLNDSAHLADEVQKAVYRKVGGSYAGVKNLGVKQGPFYVLVGATMPSILVETAFLSNDREESRLNDLNYQDCTAAGILEGIREYIASLK